MKMTIGNTLFKKSESHLVTYESGPSKTREDYCFVGRRDQRKFLKDKKILPGEKGITHHKALVCDFKIRKVKIPGESFYRRERYGNYMKTV